MQQSASSQQVGRPEQRGSTQQQSQKQQESQKQQSASAASAAPSTADFPPHLKVIKQLGRGAYGTVHLCEDTRTNTQVAVKHVRHAVRHGKSILREVRLLARLWHENLLHLLDFPAVSGQKFEDVLLVLPYMPADLHKVIQSQQALTEKHVQVIMVQILRALAHLHAAGVAHRDLKPANILLTSDCKLKICDFGLARGDMAGTCEGGDEAEQACGVLTEYVVTRWYRAPEVMLLPKQYTASVDLWSVGCILAEILGRRALFPGKNHIDMVCRVSQVIGSPADDELSWLPRSSDAYRFLRKVCPQSTGVALNTLYPRASPACLDLVRSLLRWDPSQRLSASSAQDHDYLRAYLPKEAPVPPEPFDWTFDSYKATADAVRERLYKECARFHPSILERDRASRPALNAEPGHSARYPPARQVAALGRSPSQVAALARSPSQPRACGSGTLPGPPAGTSPPVPAPVALPHAPAHCQAHASAPAAPLPPSAAAALPPTGRLGSRSLCASPEGVAAPIRSVTPRRATACGAGLVRAAAC